jgi:hypothetical protein
MSLEAWAYLAGFALALASVIATAIYLLGEQRHATYGWLFLLGVPATIFCGGLCLSLAVNVPRPAAIIMAVLTICTGLYLVLWLRRPNQATVSLPAWPSKSQVIALEVGAAALLLCAAIASVDTGDSVVPPPVGSVINATTGEVVEKVANRTTPQFVELESGDIFDACNFSRPPCKYAEGQTPLPVHIGDVVEFSIQLFDPSNEQVPYLMLYVIKGSRNMTSDLEVRLRWQAEHREWHISDYAPVTSPSPLDGGTDLTYIPGSTVLYGPHDHVLSHLPDGIMEAGIALTNIGAPASCSYCESEYVRYLNFKVQVTSGGQA